MRLEAAENQDPVSASSGPTLGPEALQQLMQELPALAALIEKYLALQLERVQAAVQKNLHGFYWAVLFILIAAGLAVLGFGFLFLALAHGVAFATGQSLGWGYFLSGMMILITLPITAKVNLNSRRRRSLLERMQKYDTKYDTTNL